jgi:DNA-binding LacI/PurR family transcriptional regulator
VSCSPGRQNSTRCSQRATSWRWALVGFDDSHAARLTDPQLTSVRQPMEEIGRSLARVLLSQLNEPDKRPASLIVPTELVIRSSS